MTEAKPRRRVGLVQLALYADVATALDAELAKRRIENPLHPISKNALINELLAKALGRT